jgi:hypothetical protein
MLYLKRLGIEIEQLTHSQAIPLSVEYERLRAWQHRQNSENLIGKATRQALETLCRKQKERQKDNEFDLPVFLVFWSNSERTFVTLRRRFSPLQYFEVHIYEVTQNTGQGYWDDTYAHPLRRDQKV